MLLMPAYKKTYRFGSCLRFLYGLHSMRVELWVQPGGLAEARGAGFRWPPAHRRRALAGWRTQKGPPIGRPVEVYGRGDQAARVLPTTRQIVASPHSYSAAVDFSAQPKAGSSLVFTGTANRPRSRPGDTSLRSRRNNARRDPRHQPSNRRRSCSPDSAAVHLLCGITR